MGLLPSVGSVVCGDPLGFPSVPVLARLLALGIGNLYVGDLRSHCFCPTSCGIVIGIGHSVCRGVLLSSLVYLLHELSPLVELGILGG